jgi:hypothetical protein
MKRSGFLSGTLSFLLAFAVHAQESKTAPGCEVYFAETRLPLFQG